ncbi:SAC3/GANP/Nin1/mts3/eIF-3 p25 family-domain-containing protein [Daldinia sp. FL1419]|nr:SAC3/GANP/Nin1/mts3/eIF-3 p25 family-domain-containing protein [Daldinia sp. FL1419]
MLNPQMQGGWGVGQAPNPPSNPFGDPISAKPANPFAPPKTNPFLQRGSNGAVPTPNPFLANSTQPPSSDQLLAQTIPQMANKKFQDSQMQTNMKNPFEIKPIDSGSYKSNQSTTSPFNPKPNPFSNPSNAQPSNTTNPFSQLTNNGAEVRPSPFGQQNPIHKVKPASQPTFTSVSHSTDTLVNGSLKPKPNPFSKPTPFASETSQTPATTNVKVSDYVQPAWANKAQATDSTPANTTSFANQAKGKRKPDDDTERRNKPSRKLLNREKAHDRSRSPAQGSKQDTSTEKGALGVSRSNQDRDEFAKKIRDQLAKDNIRPPQWPENPGSFAQRQAIERFRETYKAYREKARKSLTRAGLIDDPDKKRRLDEALVFKGICEDMCPEWEQVTRIVEHDIKGPEKRTDENGDLVAVPSLMVKRLARSAAGQDAPLPMDVRSVRTLCRTLDYLIDLVSSDDLLPQRHSFLWDRTRAIRIDFSFQKYAMTPDEILDQIYCLETIARFHVTSLHLLSRDGSAPADFSEQQEVEQLGKTLISLMEVYDDCAHQGIECKNEPEFRGYYIVFNAYNPSLMERIDGWDRKFGNAEEILSAIAIVHCIDNTRKVQGPLHPEVNSQLAIDVMSVFFKIVASPSISYTMACFAEIHFNNVRKGILKILRRSFSRPRYGPKDLTPAMLKQYLQTDTETEAVEFFKKHGFQFHEDGYVILSPNTEYTDARVRHSFSGDIVERKRSGRTLPDVIRTTVFEENVAAVSSSDESPEESLFVSNSQDVSPTDNDRQGHESLGGKSLQDGGSDSPQPSNLFTPTNFFGNHAITKPTTAIPSKQTSPSPNPMPITQSVSFTPFSTPPSNDPKTETASPVPEQLSNSLFSQTGNSTTPGSKIDRKASSSPISWWKTTTDSADKATVLDTSFMSSNREKERPPQPSASFFSGLGEKTPDPPKKTESQPSTAPMLTTPESLSKSLSLPQPINNIQPSVAGGFSTLSPLAKNPPLSALDANAQSAIATQSSISQQPSSQSTFTPQQLLPTGVPTSKGLGVVKRDLMDNFARWFVCADKGLMESQLEEFAVTSVLKAVWDEYNVIEAERIRKEEEDKINAEVRIFRESSLQLKYFRRWHDGFRRRQRIKRMNEEKEKARQWRLPENVARRERAAREEKERVVQETTDSMLRRSQHRVDETAQLRASTGLNLKWRGRRKTDTPTRTYSQSSSPGSQARSIEEALLATGVLNVVRDEKAAARYVAKDYDSEAMSDLDQERKLRLRTENRNRIERGIHRLKELPEPKVYKEGYKTAMLRARCRGSGGDTMSVSSGSLRNSTFSSSYRSSPGHNNSRVSKSRSRVADPYWTLKARGLVRMPNGEFLHESIALPMLREGKRIPGFGDYGLPAAKEVQPSQSPPLGLSSLSSPLIRADDLGVSQTSSPPSDARSQKRKRRTDESSPPIDGSNSPTNAKRAKSGDAKASSLTDADEHLADIANFMAMVEGRVSGLGNS